MFKFLLLALLVISVGLAVQAFYRQIDPSSSAAYSSINLTAVLRLKMNHNQFVVCDNSTASYKIVYNWEKLNVLNTWDPFAQTEKQLTIMDVNDAFNKSVPITYSLKDFPKGDYRVRYKVVQVMKDGRLYKLGEVVNSGFITLDATGTGATNQKLTVSCK